MYTVHKHQFQGFTAKDTSNGYRYKYETEYREAVGITLTGPIHIDFNSKWACHGGQKFDNAVQNATNAKRQREAFFPIRLLEKAIQFHCQDGKASFEKDKDRILQEIGSDAEVLDVEVHGVVAAAALNRVLAASELKAGKQDQEDRICIQDFSRAVKRGVPVMKIDLATHVDTESNLTMLLEDAEYSGLVLSTKCEALPDPLWQLKTTLTSLDICAPIKRLSSDITNLQALRHLTLRECKRLETLPDNLGELKKLNLLNIRLCSSLIALPDAVGEMSSRMYINIFGCERGLRAQLFADRDRFESPEHKKNLNSGMASLELLGVDHVVDWFKHSDWDVRKLATGSFSQLSREGWEVIAPSILVCLDHAQWYVRAAAVAVLKEMLECHVALDMEHGMDAQLALSVLGMGHLMLSGSGSGSDGAILKMSIKKIEERMPSLLASVNCAIVHTRWTMARRN